MRTVHLENGEVSLREIAKPARARGYALVRVLLAGVCNTDLELQRGYYGFAGTPGHEFVGVVEEADTPALAGRRVVGEINLACEQCDWCRKGLGRHCPRRTVLGIVKHPGAFADYLTLPERNLHALPDGLPSERAVFVEPLAAACEILEQAAIPSCAPVAVLGDGKLGLLVALTLHAHGYPVRLFGRHEEKLAIAARAGIETALGGEPPKAAFAWVVEATGKAEGLRAAIQMTEPRGTVILKSTVHGDVGVDTAAVAVQEITLVGSRCGRFEDAMPLLERNLIPVEEMITARFPLSRAPEAFAAAARPGALKVLLEVGQA
jgi:threonine dehydrogenase-like Zn-dependent dehydrogenase